MSKTYNILWIDDEHDDEALEPFIIQAGLYNIKLDGYSNGDEGLIALEKNINFYDGIILDALFFENKQSTTPNTKGLGSAIKKINQLKDVKSFPYFVLSGQTTFTEETNPIIEAFGIKCYNKKNPDDVKKLLSNVIEAADSQPYTQMKHENQKLFEVLDSYPNEVRNTFISIFKVVKGLDNDFDDQLYFTQIRIVLEHLFRKANTTGLLHDKCVQIKGSQVNLTESTLFLSGLDTKHLGVSCSKTHFPKIIANSVKSIIAITGAASHTTNVDTTLNIDIQEYRKDVNSPYLLNSLAFQTMDILIWFDNYCLNNNDLTINKSYWENLSFDMNGNKIEKAEIIKIAPNGWGTVLVGEEMKSVSVHKDDISSNNLVIGDKVSFVIKESLIAREVSKI